MSTTSGPGGVTSVTSAPKSIGQDRDERARRYVVQMVIRTVCFVLCVLTPSPWRWFFAAGAIFLPYVAVVLANAVNVHPQGQVQAADGGALAGPDIAALPAAPDEVHVGEVLHRSDP